MKYFEPCTAMVNNRDWARITSFMAVVYMTAHL